MAQTRSKIKGTGFKYCSLPDAREDITADLVKGMSTRGLWEKYRPLIATSPGWAGFKGMLASKWGITKLRTFAKKDLKAHAQQLAQTALEKQKQSIERHYEFMDQTLDKARKVVKSQKVTKENVDKILYTTSSIDVLARKLYGLDDQAPINAAQRNVAVIMNADQIINQVAALPLPVPGSTQAPASQ